MQQQNRYPKIRLRSKNELAKRISSKKFSQKDALRLINVVLQNYEKYWHDVKAMSEPEKDKFVRSAKNTPLERLLRIINDRILAPYDKKVPGFIFGGISGRSHIQAAYYLLGYKRKRARLSLDIYRFFEQTHRNRVFYFFNQKCECTEKISNLLADLCCVPFGPKGSKKDKVLARGFSTSTRLALWCNLDLFLRIYWEAKKILKNKDVRLAIFVDDIGVTASKASRDDMELLANKIEEIFYNYDPNQKLPLNNKKNIKLSSDKNIEYLGLTLGRNKITLGGKTKSRQDKVKNKLSNKNISQEERRKLIGKKKSYKNYSNYIKSLKGTNYYENPNHFNLQRRGF
ncbi:MAG: reverse transcriptase domain-containing protein [Patescibacteria group bacterium]|nr:reverse transcriptase domain-containing protein [Patescibacteria group bacterium]